MNFQTPNIKKFSIKTKLIGINSILFIVSFVTMILLATYFFRADSSVRVIETEIQIVDSVGSRVRADFLSIIEKINLLLFTTSQEFKTKEQKENFIELFFKNDANFLFVGVFTPDGEKLKLKSAIFNKESIKENKISEYEIEKSINENSRHFVNSNSGKTIIRNVSATIKLPAFAMSFPDSKNNDIIISVIHLDRIKDSFVKEKRTTISEIFLVNDQGDVIAHQNLDMVRAEKNLYDLPIVKSMLTSEFLIGEKKYKDDVSNENHIGTYKKIGFGGAGVIATVPENLVFEPVYNIQRRNIFIMLITICIAFIVIYNFSRTITDPLLKLVGATKEIEKGNFRVKIEPSFDDEVGLLTTSFVEMGLGLEERDKVKNILGSMIDPTVVKEALIDLQALKRGKETEITAFFSDVAGFSTISEQLNSVDLANLLNEYLSAMTIILKNYNGVLDKYIGDAIVGIFNAPVPVKDHSLEACRASLDMIRKLRELKGYWKENNLYTNEAREMDIRIGLNSGLAKVGFMGTDALASYTMMGDTVNLAARLEAAGKDYGVHILISEMVKVKVEEEMFTRELDTVRVKGKNEPVKLYELISKNSEVSRIIRESTEIYEDALKLYFNAKWDQAIKTFEESMKRKNNKDKSAELLIERCQYYKENPPGGSWDGVFTRKNK